MPIGRPEVPFKRVFPASVLGTARTSSRLWLARRERFDGRGILVEVALSKLRGVAAWRGRGSVIAVDLRNEDIIHLGLRPGERNGKE